MMIKFLFFLLFTIAVAGTAPVKAQCSICTRTAEQMGEKSAKGLNAGIIYLALTPLVIIGFVGYRWFRRDGE